MSRYLNKVLLIGHVGRDPEIKKLDDNKEFLSFSLATSRSWKDKVTGEKLERTEWHRVVAFSGGVFDIAKSYVKKGAKLYIEGTLRTRTWDVDGVKHSRAEIVLDFSSTLILLDSKGNTAPPEDNPYEDEVAQHEEKKLQLDRLEVESLRTHDNDDEIPF